MTSIVKSLWFTICKKTCTDMSVSERWWQLFQKRYSESQRCYHTLRHIEHMCSLLQEYKHKLVDFESLFYAMTFHDIIYEPTRGDNEEKSAELFMEYAVEAELSVITCTSQTRWSLFPKTECSMAFFHFDYLNLHVGCNMADKVRDWIVLTKTHTTPIHTTPKAYGTEDVHYFLDFDMCILGTSENDYEVYADEIRQEYMHIPDDVYKPKRARVLTSFLKTANIFSTRDFRERFEVQARRNIEKEITQLQGHKP